MNILVVKEQDDQRAMIAFLLESKFGASVKAVPRPQEALDTLLEENKIDLIVLEDQEKSIKLLKYLVSSAQEIPVILITNLQSSSVQAFSQIIFGSTQGANFLEELSTLVSKAIAEGKLSHSHASADYIRIKTELLIRVIPLKADVFIRLSLSKYIKLFKEGDQFDKNDLQKFLVQKKIDYLYLKKEASAEFIQKFADECTAIAEVPASAPPEQAAASASHIHEVVQEMGGALGFNEQVQNIAKSGIKSTLAAIGQSPKLSGLLRILNKDRDKYVASHSVAVAQVACSLAASMNWPSSTTYQKLTYAAFFHDILFTNQALAAVSSLKDLEEKKSRFTQKEIELYKTHPVETSRLIAKFNEIPPDVDQIILQHHERPDGTGFPKQVSASQISPLSSIFIMAHDIVHLVLKSQQDPFLFEDEFSTFLAEYKSKYDSGTFKKLILALEKNKGLTTKSG